MWKTLEYPATAPHLPLLTPLYPSTSSTIADYLCHQTSRDLRSKAAFSSSIMPIAPAVKGILIASSLVAAAVAAYENNPQVREFVDTTRVKAQYALEDFLENLEAELNPDPSARIRMRSRRRQRTAQAMSVGSTRGTDPGDMRTNGLDVIVAGRAASTGAAVVSGNDEIASNQGLRHRQPATQTALQDDQTSIHTSATHETFFEASNSIGNLPNTESAARDLEGLSISDDLSSHTPSVDDLLDLDPFADPLDPHYPRLEAATSRNSTPLVLSIPRPEDVAQDHTLLTPTTPTSFATMSSPILTPVTPRTPRTVASRRSSREEADVSDSYFSELDRADVADDVVDGRSASRNTSRGGIDEEVMSVHSEASSVGFETPDEDEDWGRA